MPPTYTPETATIEVRRTSDRDIKMRLLMVVLDGKEMASLKFGESWSTRIAPGPHTLRITNHLFSLEAALDLAEGEIAAFQAGNVVGLIGLVFLSLFGVGPYKVFMRRVHP